VIVEDTEADAPGTIRIHAAVQPGQNIGRRGADIAAGQRVLGAGDLLNASRLGAIAALGHSDVHVFARPRVAILSTGNEIVDPGQPLRPGQIYDINRLTLSAVIAENGCVPLPQRTVADTLEDLRHMMDAPLESDVLVFSGGSSVGERDLVLDAIAARGEILFHGIAVKPGKPTAFGRIGRTLVFGMPGYPTSCLSNAYILLAPALRKLARLPPALAKTVTVPLGARVASVKGRHQFYPVRLENGAAMPAFKASGDITSMSQADGYIEIAADVDAVEAGTAVDVTLF
jgi:molybdenum cofactor synthesis domain-containing protein